MSFRFANKFARTGADEKSTRHLDEEAAATAAGGNDAEHAVDGSENTLNNNEQQTSNAVEPKVLLNMEKNAGFLSRFFFLWFFPTLHTGYKHELKPSSIESVEPVDEPLVLYEKFRGHWDAEVSQCALADDKRPNMIKVMLLTVGRWQLFLGFLLSCVQAACLCSVPFVSQRLLELLSLSSSLWVEFDSSTSGTKQGWAG